MFGISSRITGAAIKLNVRASSRSSVLASSALFIASVTTLRTTLDQIYRCLLLPMHPSLLKWGKVLCLQICSTEVVTGTAWTP